MTYREIRDVFERVFNEEDYVKTSRLHYPDYFVVRDDTSEFLHLELFGGMNGGGKSKDYLYDLYKLFSKLEENNVLASIIRINIDVLDDIFKVEIELRDLEEFYNGKPE